MSGQHRSVFAAVTMGVLGIGWGCGPVEGPETHLSMSTPQNRSAGWGVKGVVRGTARHDELLDVLVSAKDTVFVAGYEDGQDGLAPVDPSGPSTYGTLLKYFDSTNTTTLQRGRTWFLGQDSEDEPNDTTEVIEAIALDPNGSRVFFAGRTTGSFDQPNAGQFDTIAGWLPISSTSGTFTTFQFGDEHPQHPRRLAVDTSQVIIGGYNDYTVTDGAVLAWEDPYLLKLDLGRTNGIPQTLQEATPLTWPRFTTQFTDMTLGLCVDKDDASSIYVSGSNSAGSKRGMFVRKYAADGSQIWEKTQSPIAMDMAAAVVKHPTQEGVIFAGSTYGALGTPVGDQDVVVRHLKKNGDTGWTHQDGSPGADWVTDMAVDSAGNIYVVGETLDSLDPELPSQGGYDLFVLKLSADRTRREVFQMGSAGDDHPSAIAVDEATKKIYVVGYTTGNLGLPRDNPHTTTNPTTPADPPGNYGGRDGFLLQLTPPSIMPPPGGIGI